MREFENLPADQPLRPEDLSPSRGESLMRAWLLPRPGSWRDMVLGEAPEPSPAQGDIRVAVHAVGLNPVDYKIARMGHPDWRFPHILGLDVAGVVDAIGSSVSQLKLGTGSSITVTCRSRAGLPSSR